MKTFKFFAIILVCFNLIISGCEKDDNDFDVGKGVELYQLESFEIDNNRFLINKNTVVTKTTPLIYNSDFVSYDSQQYIFEISEDSKKRLKDLEMTVSGIPFALKVDNDIIYTGYFWYGFSSQSCQGIYIWPEFIDLYNGIKVEYSELNPDIPDNRNAGEILNVFRRDNKLIE